MRPQEWRGHVDGVGGGAPYSWIDRLLGEAPPVGAVASADMVRVDPLAQTGENGWSPASVRYVPSREQPGMISAMVRLAVAPIQDRPGQRLSTAMVDRLAPYYASTFQLDEAVVRDELAKVYLYVGGPAAGLTHTAVTVGDHVYVPTDADLDMILSPRYDGWLAHELAHTMQYLDYSAGNVYRSIASYFTSMFVGHNPARPGDGYGPRTWGSIFTGSQLHHSEGVEADKPVASSRDRRLFTLTAPLAIGVPVGAALGGTLAAMRLGMIDQARAAALGPRLPSPRGDAVAGAAIVTIPMLLGSIAGQVFPAHAGVAGAAVGAASAWGGLEVARRILGRYAFTFSERGVHPVTAVAVAVGAILGAASATTSRNTVDGWSANTRLLREYRGATHVPKDLEDAMHEAHWLEVDAETVAQGFARAPAGETWDTSNWEGVVPGRRSTAREVVDWGLLVPAIIGIPVAAAVGTAVLGAKALNLGATALVGRLNGRVLGDVFSGLTSGRTVLYAYAAGAAVALAPAVVGGVVGSISSGTQPARATAKASGVIAAAFTGAALTGFMLRARPHTPALRSLLVLGGAVGGGIMGVVTASAAVNASHATERYYDV